MDNLKKQVSESVVGLDFITQLRPVSYTIDYPQVAELLGEQRESFLDASLKTKSSKRQVGFIAQEVEALVQTTGADFHGVYAPQSKEDFYGLDYAAFVVPLVKSVQEQQAVIEALKKENAELKDQFKQLLQEVREMKSQMN